MGPIWATRQEKSAYDRDRYIPEASSDPKKNSVRCCSTTWKQEFATGSFKSVNHRRLRQHRFLRGKDRILTRGAVHISDRQKMRLVSLLHNYFDLRHRLIGNRKKKGGLPLGSPRSPFSGCTDNPPTS